MANEKNQPKVERRQASQPSGEKPFLAWESPEFAEYKRSVYWYLVVAGLSLGVAAILYFQHLWGGMALVLVAMLVFVFFSETKPRDVKCAIYKEGVIINDNVYKYGDFKNFSLIYAEIPKVRYQLTGKFSGQVIMPLGKSDPEQVRLYLSKRLPEEEGSEDVVDTINRIIKF